MLIPKVKAPDNMKQLRFISLCNVVYNIICEVLANKLKTLLPSLISDSESAFMRNCYISDNVLIT